MFVHVNITHIRVNIHSSVGIKNVNQSNVYLEMNISKSF